MAKINRRSLTAEIVARLEKSIEADEDELYPGLNERPEDEISHDRSISGISKEKLLSSIEDKPLTKKDLNDAMMDAMMQVLDTLRETPPGSPSPTKGPKPRKRYPKE